MVTLIHGDNDYLSKQELKKLQATADYQIIFADEAKTIDELIFSTDNLSLFGTDQKLTILKNLSKNRRKSLFNELADYLEQNYKNLNIALYESGKFDARTKLFKVIKKHGKIIETKLSREDTLLKWISQKLQQEQIDSSLTLNSKILARVGTDQNILNNELDKLVLLVKSEGRKNIVEQDLLILTENKDAVIWDLLDAMTRRDKKTALMILENFYQNDSDFPYISAMLAKQLKMLYWLKSGEVSEEAMKKDFKVHPFTISGLKRNLSRFELPFLKMLFSKLTNLDFKVKQGKIEPKLGLVLLISSV